MAPYGLEDGFDQRCRRAIKGATEMLHRIDKLNAPLRVEIGIHGGEAIVSIMGAAHDPHHQRHR